MHSSRFGRICARVLLATAAALTGITATLGAQLPRSWVAENSTTTASFRGMSIAAPGVVWVTGTAGTFAWTTDGGIHWHAGHVAGAASFDFRAVHAFSLDTVLAMVSAQDTARIYRTTDRGRSWSLQYRDDSKGAFLDGMAFFDGRNGLAIGDPVNGHFVVLHTRDAGAHWRRLPDAAVPAALDGEGAFAASGTALITCGARDAWFATGGAAVSRVFHSADAGRTWTVATTPVAAGTAAAGIFSLACRDAHHLIAAGGNYSKPDSAAITVARSSDGGATWTASAATAATAYLSGVAYLDRKSGSPLIAVGTNGSAFSADGGATWAQMDSVSLNVVMSDVAGSAWAAGGRGRVAALNTRPATPAGASATAAGSVRQ